MTKNSYQRASNSSYHKDRRGTLGGLVQFFNFQRLFHLRRMVLGRRHCRGGDASGLRYVKVNPEKEYGSMDGEIESPGASPAVPRLTRTFSIHHLECDDYVEVCENIYAVQLESSGSIGSANDVVHNKVNELGSQLVQKKSEASRKDQKEDFAANIFWPPQFYNTSKEIFFKILQDENFSMVISKTNLTGKDNKTIVKQEETPQMSNAESLAEGMIDILDPDNRNHGHARGIHDLKTQGTDGMNKDNKKEKYRISMDGFLHKVPYGHKISPEEITLEKLGVTDRNRAPSFKRSKSLTESIDRYSLLLDSKLIREPDGRFFRRSKSVRDDSLVPAMSHSRTLERIHSLREVGSCFSRKDSQTEVSNAISFPKIPTIVPEEVNPANNMSVSDEKKTVDGPVIVKCTTEPSNVWGNEVLGPSKENNFDANNIRQEQWMPSSSVDHCVEFAFLDNMSQERSKDQNIEPEGCSGVKIANPSSNSESHFQEDPNNIKKVSASEENKELTHGYVNFFQHPESQAFHETPHPKKSTSDAIRVQIDSKDEAEYNFVREILRNSGFSGNEVSKIWNSPDQPIDFSLFEELEGSKCRLDIGLYVPDINLEHLLLFDLINEVLLDTYASALNPWLSCFSSHTRRMASESRLIEEVWAKIHWHRSHQPQLKSSLEYIISRDLSKNDGWMDLKCESEFLGQDLEAMILNDLLDEAILQL